MTKQKFQKEIEGLRTWIEVDTKALKHNYAIFRNLISKSCRLMAVAKSNAYGHDFVQYAQFMEKAGVDWIGVDSITEALALRRERIATPILVLGHTIPSRFGEAAANNISVTISSWENLRVWFALSRKPNMHLKIDTGMHRQGFMLGDAHKVAKSIMTKNASAKAEGIYTHFAAAKNPAFPRDTKKQITEFNLAVDLLRKVAPHLVRHASATGGALVFPEAHYDIVRIGIGLYGYWPSQETQAAFGDSIKLKPALSWKTIVGEIKKLPSGTRIGYDLTEKLFRPSRVAVLPIGYWHGYPRALSSIGRVMVKGVSAKVLGRVSMDMIVVDVTACPASRVGDVATLIGRDGKQEITADKVADLAGTTNYEIITRLNPLMKRMYV